MNKLRLALAAFALIAFGSLVAAQQGAFPNYPIVGGAAYCSSTTNNVCTNTVPKGPAGITGTEQVPANTELPNGTSPQNVLIGAASLHILPTIYADFTVAGNTIGPSSAVISGSNISGGAYFISGSTITVANVTLPPNPIAQQEFKIGSSASITTLKVSIDPSSTATISNAPTALTISTTGSYGYKFRFRPTDTKWYRIQ